MIRLIEHKRRFSHKAFFHTNNNMRFKAYFVQLDIMLGEMDGCTNAFYTIIFHLYLN